ncbi:MAG: hypothetical protein P8J32_06940 [bacterium]|jgi:hypothetical protein|nr:hypothetical protein [bacterium]
MVDDRSEGSENTMGFHLNPEIIQTARATATQMGDEKRREFQVGQFTFILARDTDNMLPIGTIEVGGVTWNIGVAT